jgi:hypothetical protein
MSDDQVLERFHRALIEEIQTQRPDYLTKPFTVAEIYQNLVPYGSHRDRIGVEMNGDYEDALLRLLAGEGGFLILDSEPALRDIRAELETPNPNTGLYREFAAVDVRLNQARLDLSAAAIDEIADLAEELDAEVPVPMNELAPTEAMQEMRIVPPAVDVLEGQNGPPPAKSAQPTPELEPVGSLVETGEEEDDRSGAPAAGLQPEFVESEPAAKLTEARARDSCVWCRGILPQRENLNYCPHCGTDLGLVPCPKCREELESEWRFCIACGTEVRG